MPTRTTEMVQNVVSQVWRVVRHPGILDLTRNQTRTRKRSCLTAHGGTQSAPLEEGKIWYVGRGWLLNREENCHGVFFQKGISVQGKLRHCDPTEEGYFCTATKHGTNVTETIPVVPGCNTISQLRSIARKLNFTNHLYCSW